VQEGVGHGYNASWQGSYWGLRVDVSSNL
jgi:hypothetical protein